ncbi:predicted protein [Arabidopsis lyrata subsp. lyrata]|uniref:Predicted protein n=1 Tax=Arabidopsis lyrata subsp. lyrata TaxID=81972 RepID=D7LE61_ARALL|nr:predicted protein [Arabidopsis lyrata subsp. lyrata]
MSNLICWIDKQVRNQLSVIRSTGDRRYEKGDTKVLAAVYGPKAGTKKNENDEKACFEVIWKPKTGQIGKVEKEYEMILKRTMQSICVLTVNPNTTTSVIIQVVHDDGSISFLCSLPLGKHLLMLSQTHIIRYKQCRFEYL